MWRPWWKLLNALGRFRLPHLKGTMKLNVGDPAAGDAQLGLDWKRFLSAEALYDVWGPPMGSPWRSYHAVPLFAVLRNLKAELVGPTSTESASAVETNTHAVEAPTGRALGAGWVEARRWVILDLPGPLSVPLAVRLVAGGFQPVCTFDHWPNPAGLVKGELVLAQLLRYAGLMEQQRQLVGPGAPPVWICDRARLGNPGAKRTGVYDNRYYLDDAALPGVEALRAAGITGILCVLPSNVSKPSDDLCAYFRDLKQLGFHEIQGVAVDDTELTPFEFPHSVFDAKFDDSTYGRSAAGGFGVLIPEPSSGGG